MTASYLRLVRAPNPGPMTLDGTNAWLLGEPAAGPLVVVDPGPLHAAHLEAIEAAAPRGIGGVLLTHRHLDHSESATELAQRAGCGVRAADPAVRVGPDGLGDGDQVEVAGATLTVVTTPGHTSDSVSLLVAGDDGVVRLLSGDTVLGRGTTVITSPDGDLAAYLDSLTRLRDLVAERGVAEILPGHGPTVTDPAGWLAYYVEHRQQRLEQVRAALAMGARTPAEVVAKVYADVDRRVWPAAKQSVRAQLDYLKRSEDSGGTHR
ncbi:MAG TPA: MBL fold metallo-hydrolase [Propionibacteriaceae bacterium]|jgi:glyoxylase-like metal-dependent hydrolase (beta-lactamase superfamily II)|nr:MBL fold metallo-hydrolase [Propionibacteriaceae bacterium]